jgi:hypothetical protein
MFTGATIATGAIANTASVSTGAFTVSAAIFMCVPRFILPGIGRHQIILFTLSRTSPRLLPPLPPHLLPLNTTH